MMGIFFSDLKPRSRSQAAAVRHAVNVPNLFTTPHPEIIEPRRVPSVPQGSPADPSKLPPLTCITPILFPRRRRATAVGPFLTLHEKPPHHHHIIHKQTMHRKRDGRTAGRGSLECLQAPQTVCRASALECPTAWRRIRRHPPVFYSMHRRTARRLSRRSDARLGILLPPDNQRRLVPTNTHTHTHPQQTRRVVNDA